MVLMSWHNCVFDLRFGISACACRQATNCGNAMIDAFCSDDVWQGTSVDRCACSNMQDIFVLAHLALRDEQDFASVPG